MFSASSGSIGSGDFSNQLAIGKPEKQGSRQSSVSLPRSALTAAIHKLGQDFKRSSSEGAVSIASTLTEAGTGPVNAKLYGSAPNVRSVQLLAGFAANESQLHRPESGTSLAKSLSRFAKASSLSELNKLPEVPEHAR